MIGTDDLETASAPHRETFLTHLDDAFRRYGYPEGLPERLRAAVRATPRHRFVHRFRANSDGPLHDLDADPISLLPVVYHGQPLTHVAADGTPLPSTNSEAAYVLWLVERLGVEPTQQILEIGSGSGWLLAVMAHLAGPEGAVTGIEIIPSLADQSRADLAELGRGNARVLTADATCEPISGAPFDRVIITAATWSLPAAFFDLVAEGGKLLVPLRLPRDEGCEVTLLRRESCGFRAEWSFPGFFVPLVGASQSAEIARVRIDEWTVQAGIDAEPSLSYPFWFASLAPSLPGTASPAFRRHLAMTEPGFTIFEPAAARPAAAKWLSDFGLLDGKAGSAAIMRAGRLIGYGAPTATRQLLESYRRWCDLGMPGPTAYKLQVIPTEATVSNETAALTEVRGDSTFIRSIDAHAGAWCNLLERTSS